MNRDVEWYLLSYKLKFVVGIVMDWLLIFTLWAIWKRKLIFFSTGDGFITKRSDAKYDILKKIQI